MATATKVSSVLSIDGLAALGPIVAITIYNRLRRLPTKGMTALTRAKQEATESTEPIARKAGWISGEQIVALLEYAGGCMQLVDTNHGGKFEAFLTPGNPESDTWLRDSQTRKVMDSIRRQNLGIVAIYHNPQGIMLVLTPLSNQTVGRPTEISFEIDGDQIILMAPAELIR